MRTIITPPSSRDLPHSFQRAPHCLPDCCHCCSTLLGRVFTNLLWSSSGVLSPQIILHQSLLIQLISSIFVTCNTFVFPAFFYLRLVDKVNASKDGIKRSYQYMALLHSALESGTIRTISFLINCCIYFSFRLHSLVRTMSVGYF